MLSISYVGMKTRDIGILEQTSIKVRLQPDTEIDEVVVTGYGVVQRREDLVGSAYQVTAKKLELMPVASVDKMLDGLVPGMTVTSGFNNNDESMRARMTVRIRGDASLNTANNPLWVVDGAPIYTGDINGMTIGTSYTVAPLSFLNPNDIESITVLKDASTTALYGADGANGVILITTKSGQAGKTSVNASVKYGIAFANESTRFKVLNASQYMQYAQEAWTNAGYPISAFPYQDNEYNSYSTTDTKWHDLYLDVGQTLQVDVSASGGNDRMKNYISGGYYTEDMILKGNRQQRISLRANSSYKLTRTFEASLSLSGTYNINNIFPSTRNYYMMLPIFSPYENDGHTYRLYNYYSRDSYFEYAPRLYKFTANDLPERDQNDNDQYSLNAQMNASLKWEPIQGLSVTTQFVSNYISTYEGIYNGRTSRDTSRIRPWGSRTAPESSISTGRASAASTSPGSSDGTGSTPWRDSSSRTRRTATSRSRATVSSTTRSRRSTMSRMPISTEGATPISTVRSPTWGRRHTPTTTATTSRPTSGVRDSPNSGSIPAGRPSGRSAWDGTSTTRNSSAARSSTR